MKGEEGTGRMKGLKAKGKIVKNTNEERKKEEDRAGGKRTEQ